MTKYWTGYKNHWNGRDLAGGMSDTFDEVAEIEDEAMNEGLGR